MKIGILTYHRTLNYGACLQAIATRITLEKMGHQAFYVDYWPKYHQNIYKVFSLKKLKSLTSLKWKLRYLISIGYRLKRINNFKPFLNRYITPYCRTTEEQFDTIVYGSDQIWRKQKELKGYNPIYFAKNEFKAHKHVAYSASMGLMPNTYEEKEQIKSFISNFSSISVRENDLREFLISIGVENIHLTLDPTLLLQAEEWDRIIPTAPYNGQKYVLVYGISRQSPFDIGSINEYAKKKGCIVKRLYGTAEKKDTPNDYFTANPYEFIRLIKNAECIFTSSFHGLAFSIIYQKEFFASYKNNSNRALTLLSSLNLTDRLISTNQQIPQEHESIDYIEVNTQKDLLIDYSLEYLSHSL